MAIEFGSAYHRTRATVYVLISLAFTALMAVVTVRVLLQHEWDSGIVAAGVTIGCGVAARRWYRQLRV